MTESQTIAANAMWTRCQQSIGGMPDGPLSARIVSNSNRPFVLAINQSQVSAGKHMSYNGSQQGSRVVILPVLRRNHTENNRAWSSGFQVQNAGDGNTCFAVSYFTPAGARALPGRAPAVSIRAMRRASTCPTSRSTG
jgi:hypothetical protein